MPWIVCDAPRAYDTYGVAHGYRINAQSFSLVCQILMQPYLAHTLIRWRLLDELAEFKVDCVTWRFCRGNNAHMRRSGLNNPPTNCVTPEGTWPLCMVVFQESF